jgi:hypothetical protein
LSAACRNRPRSSGEHAEPVIFVSDCLARVSAAGTQYFRCFEEYQRTEAVVCV